ncbi:MAG: glycerol-3-phosphate dehydrogenase/oxidase [Deltaproteobacteria bacterium]|nr:glycerol-3-phosphate dehydrogenase/oxidase [Deltaproteobacteria bacterium]MBW2347182.1 glycerol-3-phosphate dehydrogenase/oxidase [Deltaproteobacteria bacterium]
MFLEDVEESWDLVVIGGGITGAGILLEAARAGLRALLLEQRDFAWGTSGRSSKLVHGGLRYIRDGHLMLTRVSVRERERLLREAAGLVEPLEFVIPIYDGHKLGKKALGFALTIYSILAHKRQHVYLEAAELRERASLLVSEGLQGGFQYLDARVDDARLVLRVIQEAESLGACALNYCAVTEVRRSRAGKMRGVGVRDVETGVERSFSSPVVINATGAWAESLHPCPEPGRRIRPLRGSHLVFPASVIPLERALTLEHPVDQRPVFLIPWEGVVVYGTTDLDHHEDLCYEPVISTEEARYLMEGLRHILPGVSTAQCLSSYAGVRPVLSRGDRPPSKESREHAVWKDEGLVTVTGGKLTTFRRLAWDALHAAGVLPGKGEREERKAPVFVRTAEILNRPPDLSPETWARLMGRYGAAAGDMVAAAGAGDLDAVPGTRTLWVELAHAARCGKVRHLEDLLLRRVRLGVCTPLGGREHIERVRTLCAPHLPWDQRRWEEEIAAYVRLWEHHYAPPKV